MAQKPAIPKGTRDFLPQDVARRTYIFDTVKSVFKTYGFAPIETPSFELSSTLLGKYGEEGDRLIFRILNSGNYLTHHNSMVSAYVEGVLETAIDSLFEEVKKSDSVSFDEIMNSLISESFMNRLTDLFNEKNKGNELPSFYSSRLAESIESRIRVIRRSPFIKDTLKKIFDECSDCPPTEDHRMRAIIKETTLVILGKYLSGTGGELTKHISEKALRYDLTVPFARFVVQHQNELSFPFKRYQIQPVWRADRPQHGRYQEFFQCDADVVGSDSLLFEVDFVQIFDQVLTKLKIPGFTIKINNRKILSGIAEVSGESDKIIDITVAIDKLDKIGEEGVVKELLEKGVSEKAIEIISPLFKISGSNDERLAQMKSFLANSEIGLKGIEELEFVLESTKTLGLERAEVEFDVTLARGLNYYTGAIFEVKVHDVKMGSICGGGRYDDLTGLFGLSGMSGVGISFGADRIYDVLNELNLYPEETDASLSVLFANFGDKEAQYCMKLCKELRNHGIDCEVYPSSAKMQKQFKYADSRKAKHVAIIGESELANGTIQVKNMESGEQVAITAAELVNYFSK